MISLLELMHSAEKHTKDGLIAIDDWRWPDVDHLMTMGFIMADDYRMITKTSTTEDGSNKITIYRKKDKDADGKIQKFFILEEPNRQTKRFRNFNDVIDYFDTYEQPACDKDR
jgi:hypothetical protein